MTIEDKMACAVFMLLVSAKQTSSFFGLCYFVTIEKLKWFGFTSGLQLFCWVIKHTVEEPVMNSIAYVPCLFVLYK